MTTTTITEEPTHCAKFTDSIAKRIAHHLDYLPGPILDPFAGTGRIHTIAETVGRTDTTGIEIEHEWADMHPRTHCANTLTTDLIKPQSIGSIITSPAYGNRMADNYDGRDGSKRMTYRLSLGRKLSDHNSGGMQWGTNYRHFHTLAYTRFHQWTRPGGYMLLNIKDHRRKGQTIRVTDWHLRTLLATGYDFITAERIDVPGHGFGKNLDTRITFETLLILQKPESHTP